MTVQSELIAWVALAVAVVAFLVAVVTSRQQTRIEAIEQRMSKLPTTEEVTGIRINLASLEAKQEATLAEARTTRTSIRRVEDFLLKMSRDHDSQF